MSKQILLGFTFFSPSRSTFEERRNRHGAISEVCVTPSPNAIISGSERDPIASQAIYGLTTWKSQLMEVSNGSASVVHRCPQPPFLVFRLCISQLFAGHATRMAQHYLKDHPEVDITPPKNKKLRQVTLPELGDRKWSTHDHDETYRCAYLSPKSFVFGVCDFE